MLSLIFPRRCPYCDCVLLPSEQGLCLRCLALLPRVRAELPGNEVEHRLLGRFPFEHATSFCYYGHLSPFGAIIRRAKYGGHPWLNARLARLFVDELALAARQHGVPGWPYDVDVIVPVPLHLLRYLGRGYNQSVAIAEELARAWQLPVETSCLVKSRFTPSQVGLSGQQRLHNEAGSFAVRHPDRLAARHVLIVDDVLTTGATVVAVADALLQAVPGVRLSVLTLAMAKG